MHLCGQEQMDKNKLDHYFDQLDAHKQFMGTVLVSKSDQIIYNRSIGYADIDSQTKNQLESKYRIGSISKTFTSVLIFKAIEEGNLSLTTPIAEFFLDFPNGNNITIDHLLSHSSGLGNYTNREDYNHYFNREFTREDMVKLIANLDTQFYPGVNQAYSNSNYLLLTYILEDIYDTSFAKLFQAKISNPFNLKATYVETVDSQNTGLSKGYKFSKSYNLSDLTSPSVLLGAGGIISTASDLLSFSKQLFNKALVEQNSLAAMTPQGKPIGRGLLVIPFYEYLGLGHAGSIDGNTSLLAYFEDSDLTVVVLSNGAEMNVNDVNIAVLSAFYGKEINLPNFSTVNVDSAVFEKLTGVYSSSVLPLKFTITVEEEVLTARLEGQPSFPLTPLSETAYVYRSAGVEIVFNPQENSLLLKQSGMKIPFVKPD